MTIIYHMADKDEWDAAKAAGAYPGSENDQNDGFIHFSTADTVIESAAKHRTGEKNLVLLTVESEKLGEDLKWEAARGGVLFPHLYASLDPKLVLKAEALPLDQNALHIFPELV